MTETLEDIIVEMIGDILKASTLIAQHVNSPHADVQHALKAFRLHPGVQAMLGNAPAVEKVGGPAVEPTGKPTCPCPKCGEPCDIFDWTGVLCFHCETSFDSGLPGEWELARLSSDPDHVAWIDRIVALGWKPQDGTGFDDSQRGKANATPDLDTLPADHPARRPPPTVRKRPLPMPRLVWECPDCGWCNDTAPDADQARVLIAAAKTRAGHRPPTCACPNLHQKQP